MIINCIVVTVVAYVVTVESMFYQNGNNLVGKPDPFTDPLFWEYYFMFTNSGPYAKDMITPGSDNTVMPSNTSPRGQNSPAFRQRTTDTGNQFLDKNRNHIDLNSYNLPGNRGAYHGNNNERKNLVENKIEYNMPDPSAIGRLRPSPMGNVSPALQGHENQNDKQNSIQKLVNTLTLKSGYEGIKGSSLVDGSPSDLSKALTYSSTTGGPLQPPASERNTVEGGFRSGMTRDSSLPFNLMGENGPKLDLSTLLTTRIPSGKPVSSSHLERPIDRSRTALSNLFISPTANEGLAKQSSLSQQPQTRPDQSSEMLKTLILSGSLQITDPLTLHYLLKDTKGQSANIVPYLAMAGGGENMNPLLLNHILSSYSTQNTGEKNLTDKGMNKINSILLPLLLSHGGENMNHLLLQSILSQPNQYQSSPNLLQTLALTSGGESPLMQNPAVMNLLMQSIGQPTGGNSIQHFLPLFLGNEEMSENPTLSMQMLRRIPLRPYK